MRYLRVKNWTEFQHYKDRNPLWIKLHVALLDDYEFCRLPDVLKGQLMLLWLFASKRSGLIPNDAQFLKEKIGLTTKLDLGVLIDQGFLIPTDEENAPTEKWATRYVSDEVKAAAMGRADSKCQSCSSTDNLEFDHIVPISQGGDGKESNIQVLCRPCNRRKRMRTTTYAGAEQDATQVRSPRALAREEERREEESTFASFWEAYPKKVSKPDALKAWHRLSLHNGDFENLMTALGRFKESSGWLEANGKYIPHPATWLNKRRFEDEVIVPVKKVALD